MVLQNLKMSAIAEQNQSLQNSPEKYANSERRLSSPFRVTDFHSELNREHHYERIRAQKKI